MAEKMTDIGQILERPSIRTLARIFANANEELYLVGGSVRDAMTGIKPDDLDFTTSARPDKILELVEPLGTVWRAGERFGTIGVLVNGEKTEITTFRADKYDGTSRKPIVVFGNNVEEDLRRRDLTINALAINVVTGQLVDPYRGQLDLMESILRTPVDPNITIREDPLRALRAIRFSVLRGYAIATDLQHAILDNASWLSIVSQERKTAEMMKIAEAGLFATIRAAALSRVLGIYGDLFGELSINSNNGWWRSYGPFSFKNDAIGALAASVAPSDSVQVVNALLEMKLSSAEIMRCGAILNAVDKIREMKTTVGQREIVRRYADDVLRPALEIASALDGHKNKTVQFELLSNAEQIRGPLPVDGYSFMAEGLEGKQIGEALRAVERWFLETLSTNKEIALAVGLEAIHG